jgi:hypothetical protein
MFNLLLSAGLEALRKLLTYPFTLYWHGLCVDGITALICGKKSFSIQKTLWYSFGTRARGGAVVEALRYKPEVRGFDS